MHMRVLLVTSPQGGVLQHYQSFPHLPRGHSAHGMMGRYQALCSPSDPRAGGTPGPGTSSSSRYELSRMASQPGPLARLHAFVSASAAVPIQCIWPHRQWRALGRGWGPACAWEAHCGGARQRLSSRVTRGLPWQGTGYSESALKEALVALATAVATHNHVRSYHPQLPLLVLCQSPPTALPSTVSQE